MTPELEAQILTVAPAFDMGDTGIQAAADALTPHVVVSTISDVPTTCIDATIALRDQRISCECCAPTLTAARALKESLIAALQGWRGGAIAACAFESGGPELFDADLVPPRYIIPVDFMLTF